VWCNWWTDVLIITSTTEDEGGYVFTLLCLFVCRISKKVVGRSRWNFGGMFGVGQGRTDLILMKIWFRIWIRELFNFQSDSSPLRDLCPKRYIAWYFKNWLGPNMFSWIRYYVAEVCALPSALLVAFYINICNCFCNIYEECGCSKFSIYMIKLLPKNRYL